MPNSPSEQPRLGIIERGYPGYDTSIGWFQYSDDTIKQNIIKSLDQGFDAVKLKVGSLDPQRDIRRAFSSARRWASPPAYA